MATNDIILVDKLFADFRASSGIADIGTAFEKFAIRQYLKDAEISDEEADDGLVGGKDEGGIDAWYLFLDDTVVSDEDDIIVKGRTPVVDVIVATIKHGDSFKLAPVTNLCAAMDELCDLRRSEADLTSVYNDEIIDRREVLRKVLIACADRHPRFRFRLAYLSRGDSQSVDPSILARAERSKESVQKHFSDAEVSFEFVGASELLALYRKLKDFSARLPYEDSYLSRGKSNYLCLARLVDIRHLVTDADGSIKRHLFDSNVRDYVGKNTFVNSQIGNTLQRTIGADQEDFWWLNNGITMLATDAKVVGKDLFLKNVQIVNGLQTTETIFKQFQDGNIQDTDDRCVLVKVVVTENKELSDRIILATNSQEKVDAASLRATDKIQRDIEQLLEGHGWFYNRRKHFHENRGRPNARIVSVRFMSYCTISLCRNQPYNAHRSRPRYMNDDREYHEIFSSEWNLGVYLAALTLVHGVGEAMMRVQLPNMGKYNAATFVSLFRFLYAALYAQAYIGTPRFHPNVLERIASDKVDARLLDTVNRAFDVAVVEFTKVNGRSRKLHRSSEFYSLACQKLGELLASDKATKRETSGSS
jgi:hypothetical protein